MSEIGATKQFLSNLLTEALDLEVYETPAPQNSPYPLCTYSVEPEPDTLSKRSVVYSEFESVVRIIGKGNLGPLLSHVDAVAEALPAASKGGVSGYHVALTRRGPFRLPAYVFEGSEVLVQEVGYRLGVRVTKL